MESTHGDEKNRSEAERHFLLLVPMLADPDLEVRCGASEAILRSTRAEG